MSSRFSQLQSLGLTNNESDDYGTLASASPRRELGTQERNMSGPALRPPESTTDKTAVTGYPAAPLPASGPDALIPVLQHGLKTTPILLAQAASDYIV